MQFDDIATLGLQARLRILAVCYLALIFLTVFRSSTLRVTIETVKSLHLSNEDVFVEYALQVDFTGAYNGTSLQDLCSEREWREGLVFSCGRMYGSIGHVRNMMLNCVRFAIEAGAELLLPPIASGEEGGVSKLEGENGFMHFASMFDAGHFVDTLGINCPQMKLHANQDALWDKPTSAIVLGLSPIGLVEDVMFHRTMGIPETFRTLFNGWLKQKIEESPILTEPSPRNPVHVEIVFPLFQWRTTVDNAAFIVNFGRLLRYPKQIRRLSAKVLYSLSESYNLRLQPTGITPGAFMGMHLRTESDASKSKFHGYAKESKFLLDMAARHDYSLVYIASGGPTDSVRIKRDAAQHGNRTILTKFDLLAASDLEELQSLRWEQQALVDFGVLERCSLLGGTGESSVSFNLALKRHAFSERDDFQTGPKGIMFEDEFSQLDGKAGDRAYLPIAMWP